jgi:rhamnogalacturonyl hydrolase YesR
MMQFNEVVEGKSVAADVADYISNIQSRLPDGALYRKISFSPLMEGTLWADDLYMSVPFLCKYYRLTGKIEYIEDAAKQFVLFKKYLYMPDKKIMSHVYNDNLHSATGVAWGRGNGWVLFSLTELLELLPTDHTLRPELIAFFNELSEGYSALQDEDGMWHQVLTDHESYSESSCTSMFVYGFSRGVRFGWLKDKEKYTKAVLKAWEALTKITIDKYGNVYGICKGSAYSYSPSYYKNDLSWNLNDAHGTGIVMLAGL